MSIQSSMEVPAKSGSTGPNAGQLLVMSVSLSICLKENCPAQTKGQYQKPRQGVKQNLAAYLGIVIVVQCESVVDPFWQNDEVALTAPDANPPVVQVSHIKVS